MYLVIVSREAKQARYIPRSLQSFIYTYLLDFLVSLSNEMFFRRSRFAFCFQPTRQSWTITCYLDTNHKQ